MQQPYQCWTCNGRIQWAEPGADDDVRDWCPRCDMCGGELSGPVSPGRCNSCGRELVNQTEDEVGLCAVCMN